jgi:exopolyphosphatase/guanosine-5'-triphosphate,3'-diphosphate pyrophosphatase
VSGRESLLQPLRPAISSRRWAPTRVAVIDVGSSNARLLVAEQSPNGVERVGDAKAYLGLGAEILGRGEVGLDKLAETAIQTRRLATIARELDAEAIDVFVTAPGRQARNGDLLVETIAGATGQLVRVLSAREEGELSFEGAMATTLAGRGLTAVCDVGGGSTEITVGHRDGGALWSDSAELGSLRLTAAMLHADPPTKQQLAAAKTLVATTFETLRPPRVKSALVVGGSARALARIVGRRLDEASLRSALRTIVSRPADELARREGLDAPRAATLAGGALILLDLTRRLGMPLQLAGGGLRDGAAARLLETSAAPRSDRSLF